LFPFVDYLTHTPGPVKLKKGENEPMRRRRDPNVLKEHVLHVVQSRNSTKPIKMKNLAQRCDCSTRHIREAVHTLRVEDNLPVCGDNTGYYWPRFKTEWEITSRRLKSAAKKIMDAAEGGDKYFINAETNQESMF
jgi:hypothetical protein